MSGVPRLMFASLAVALAAIEVAGAARQVRPGATAPMDARAAILVVDLASWRHVFVQRPELINTRVAPGSILKIATLVAGLESGLITPATRFSCRRTVTAGDRQLVCVHPDLGRPMTPAEALAHSCNDFFVTLAQRLPRETLSGTTSLLGLGPVAPGAPVALAAVGLAGIEATPEQLLRALVRALDPGLRIRPETREVLLEGLRGSAVYGTAQALGAAGIDAFASNATVPVGGSGYQGLSVAVAPSRAPSLGVVVLLPGGSAGDAAAVAAPALSTAQQGPAQTPELPPASRPPPDRASGKPVPPASRQDASSGATLRIGRAHAGSYDVVSVPLEEYVARVVAGEAAPRSARAALEAIAIAVRTFAITNRTRHQADGFDLCDQTHCQVMATATAATRQAAEATAGRILLFGGEPAAVFYTACCGGQSELPEDVWPRATSQPFLKRHKESECRKVSAWQCEITVEDLMRALHAAGFAGDRLRNLKVARRSRSGRAAVLRVEGLQPEAITGDDLRMAVGRTLGWQYLKSTAFDVKRTKVTYKFSGRGSGHGVGLCLIGAARMGSEGKTAAAILKEYFPGTTIGLMPERETLAIREKHGALFARDNQAFK